MSCIFKHKIPNGEYDDDSSIKDITSTLKSNEETIYRTNNLKLFSVSLEYLIKNAEKLVREKDKNHYISYGKYVYFSPSNIQYDFTAENIIITQKGANSPGLILSESKQPIPFFLLDGLLGLIPEMAYKSYTPFYKDAIEPIGISNPTFIINQNPKNNILVPLKLIKVTEVFELTGMRFHKKIGYEAVENQVK